MGVTGRRLNLDEGNLKNELTKIWYDAIVMVNIDPQGAQRIKVKVLGIDNELTNDDIINSDEWVTPLIPKFVNITPKIGEYVTVWVPDIKNPKFNRFYLGPFISQTQNLSYDPYYFTARAGTSVSLTTLSESWKVKPSTIDENVKNWKIFPNEDDIALSSRRNSDIILRAETSYDEIQLRSGKWNYQNIYDLNKKNPGYITISYWQPQKRSNNADIKKLNLDTDRTHTNVVSDNINLISHYGSSAKGKAPAILSGDIDAQLKTEQDKLHPLLYGDMFWEFTQLIGNFVSSHIHKGSRREPDNSGATEALLNWIKSNSGKKLTKKRPDGTKYDEIDGATFLSKGVKTN